MVKVDHVELIALVASGVDLDHGSSGAKEVLCAAHRFFQSRQGDQAARNVLVQLHRPGQVAAHEDPFRRSRLGPGLDVGEMGGPR